MHHNLVSSFDLVVGFDWMLRFMANLHRPLNNMSVDMAHRTVGRARHFDGPWGCAPLWTAALGAV
jgi:hypothetical protein